MCCIMGNPSRKDPNLAALTAFLDPKHVGCLEWYCLVQELQIAQSVPDLEPKY
jgi:hypothetical protein